LLGIAFLAISPGMRAAPETEESAPPEARSRGGDGEEAARELFSRIAESAGLLGKGSVRVLVLPVSLLQPDAAEALPAAPDPPPESKEPEPSYWFPNAMVEGPLTDRVALEDEIARLLRGAGKNVPVRPGAPSPALIAVLEASQRAAWEAARAERVASQSPTLPRGGQLGRGLPWKGVRKPGKGANPEAVEEGSAVVAADAGRPSVPARRDQPAAKPEAAREERYVAVLVHAPFHAFGETPDETIPIELAGDEVGRVRGRGQEWAWVQLDSGLMGVIRSRFLREAAPGEIERFLALEGDTGRGREDLDIGIMDLDAFGNLIQSEAAASGPEGPGGKGGKPVAPLPGGREIRVEEALE
jgi:hypothetical protein